MFTIDVNPYTYTPTGTLCKLEDVISPDDFGNVKFNVIVSLVLVILVCCVTQ